MDGNYYYIADSRLNITNNIFSNWLYYTAINSWSVLNMASIVGMWPYLKFEEVTGSSFYFVAPIMRTYMGIQQRLMEEFNNFVFFEVYLSLVRGWSRNAGYSIRGQRTSTNNKTAPSVFTKNQSFGRTNV